MANYLHSRLRFAVADLKNDLEFGLLRYKETAKVWDFVLMLEKSSCFLLVAHR